MRVCDEVGENTPVITTCHDRAMRSGESYQLRMYLFYLVYVGVFGFS